MFLSPSLYFPTFKVNTYHSFLYTCAILPFFSSSVPLILKFQIVGWVGPCKTAEGKLSCPSESRTPFPDHQPCRDTDRVVEDHQKAYRQEMGY